MAAPIRFASILFSSEASPVLRREPPAFFADLNLDQIVAGVTAGREEYGLAPFLYTPIGSLAELNYRYAVLQDLRNATLLDCVRAFARAMKNVRRHLADEVRYYYRRQKQSAFVEAADCYCVAVAELAKNLAPLALQSDGFLAFREFLFEHVESNVFTRLVNETQELKSELARVRYRLHIAERAVTVGLCQDEPDYRAEVLAAFDKFKEGGSKEYRFQRQFSFEMNSVEAAILDLVARLYPDVFALLDSYTTRFTGFVDQTISLFDRQVQFYMAWIEYIEPFKQAGLSFCFPNVSDDSKAIHAADTFDLALAARLLRENAVVVTNDFHLASQERILVVTGPNQGGKTTFARTIGQLHYLSSIGAPIPGRSAQLYFFDQIYTHFERAEDIRNLTGKLEDELIRIRGILASATSKSLLIMNESFASATLSDSIFLNKRIMERVGELDMICVVVTFLDEIASSGASTVSMVSAMDPSEPAKRTFKIVRRPPTGLAFAAAIAEKHLLTYGQVRERIAANARNKNA